MRITVRENRKSESWGEIADLLRGTVRVMHASLEQVVEYLEG